MAAPGSALAAPATSEACPRDSSPARAAAPRPGCSPMARPASMPRRASLSEVPDARASCSATWARGAERPAMLAAVSDGDGRAQPLDRAGIAEHPCQLAEGDEGGVVGGGEAGQGAAQLGKPVGHYRLPPPLR